MPAAPMPGWVHTGVRSSIHGGIRAAKLLAYAMGIVVALTLLLMLALQFPAVRTNLLEFALPRAASSLPGVIDVEAAHWPAIGRIVFEGLVWRSTADRPANNTTPDTLAAADRLEIDFDPLALLRRDLVLRDLILRHGQLDYAAMQHQWAQSPSDTTHSAGAGPKGAREGGADERHEGNTDTGDSALPWFREGAIPRWPSVDVRNLQIEISRIGLHQAGAIRDISADGHIRMRHGFLPELSLRLEGRLAPEWPVIAQADLGQGDSLRITVQRGDSLGTAVTHGQPNRDEANHGEPNHGDRPPQGLWLRASVDHRSGHLRSVRGLATIRVPSREELHAIPFLSNTFDGIPAFNAWAVAVKGSVSTQPELRGELLVNVNPGSWLRRGTARFAFEPDETRADSVDVRLADLRLTGAWRRQSAHHQGQVTVSAEGTEWLKPLLPSATLPETLSANLTARLEGPEDALVVELHLDGQAVVRGFTVRDLSLAAEGRLAPEDPMRFAMETVTAEYLLGGSGRVSYDDSLHAELAPWTVEFADSSDGADVTQIPEAPAPRNRGSVIYAPKADSLWARDLRLLTPAGQVVLNGHLSGGRARLQADLQWPEPPEAFRRWADVAAASWDSVRNRWDPPYTLSGELRRTPAAEGNANEGSASESNASDGDRIEIDATFDLPGPFVLGPAVLPSGDWSGLASLRGRTSIRRTAEAAGWTARADLSQTEWIDQLLVAGIIGGPRHLFGLDSLRLDLLGIEGEGEGWWGHDDLAGSLSVSLSEPELLRRWAPNWSQQDSLALRVDAHLEGSPGRPDLSASYEGRFHAYGWRAPRFEGRVGHAGPARTYVRLSLPDGLAGPGLRLDSVRVEYEPAGSDTATSWTGRGRVLLAGDQLSLAAAGRIDAGRRSEVRADSLRISIADRSMSARVPLTVRLPAGDQRLRVDSLDLAGDLGTLRGHLWLEPQGAAARLTADLNLPARPLWIPIPAGAWPGRLRLDLQSAPRESVRVNLRAEGLALGPDEDIDVRFQAVHQDRVLQSSLQAMRGDDPLLSVTADYPADLSLEPFALSPRGDSLTTRFTVDDFPLPPVARNPLRTPGYLHRGGQQRTPRLTLNGRASGKLNRPRVVFSGDITFPNYDELSDYRFEFHGRHGPATWSPATAGADSVLRELADFGPGAALRLVAKAADERILTARLQLPPAPWARTSSGSDSGSDTTRTLALHVRSNGRMDISDLAPLFPRIHRLGGAIEIEASVTGTMANPALDGSIRLHETQVVLREGTRATGGGHVELSGTMRAPAVDGQVTVHNGRIQIPEAQRDLHPREGQSLLWTQKEVERIFPRGQEPDTLGTGSSRSAAGLAADTSGAPADTAGARGSERAATSLGSQDAQLELEAEIEIPSGVWLVGRGLEVELSGSLSIMRSADPNRGLTLGGSLSARRGSMSFHGQQLQVEEGTVTFFGSEQLDPALDLKLYKRQGEVKVTVHITGTVQEPRLSLSSQPEMSQSDILAFLIFGQRSEGLDQAESRRLEDRALATAEQFAASRLTQQIGRELGFDVLEYEASAGDSLGRSITIGKYLSPNLLVKYEQYLESTLGIGVVVEYYLSKGFQLQLQTRREDQDGIMFNWEHDFR